MTSIHIPTKTTKTADNRDGPFLPLTRFSLDSSTEHIRRLLHPQLLALSQAMIELAMIYSNYTAGNWSSGAHICFS